MRNPLSNPGFALIFTLFLSGCTAAKLEARLEANPQCKDVLNPKTGSLMPCPGSDKAFYKAAGLAPAVPSVVVNDSSSMTQTADDASISASPLKSAPSSMDCKPQIHKKTGGALPCPSSD